MSINPDCGCSNKRSLSEEKLVELVVNEVQNYFNILLNHEKTKSDLKYPLIPLGISNRHIHLTSETFHKLFGTDTEFESLRPLYQPGEFASKHSLTISGPKMRCIQNVRILGPLRKYDQVEISLTDAIFLGIKPPITNSGTLDNASPLTLNGPVCSVFIDKCTIIANRHIHMTNKDALLFGVKNGDYCKVRIKGQKGTIFENVLIRINDNWKLQIHLDTDDANAANANENTLIEFLKKM